MTTLIHHISELALGPRAEGPNTLETVEHGAVVVEADRVVWAGEEASLPPDIGSRVTQRIDAEGRAVLPGLVDSHTHLVFAGCRAHEFSRRCAGATYEEIAESGGGIRVTAAAVRGATEEALIDLALPRLMSLLRGGVTTVEIKSGYGLSVESELKMLRVIRALKERTPQRLVPTFLGAHVVGPEYRGNADAYVDLVVDEMLPAVAAEGLAVFCDVFCETTAFSVEQCVRVLRAAKSLGMKLKVHAEQLSASGGTQMATEMGACSVDHCEWIQEKDFQALEASNTVATLLPGATLFLGMSRWAPARELLSRGIPVALSTDCNPGSSMTTNLFLMAHFGCTQLGMSAEEALAAVTSVGAQALDLAPLGGTLREGSRADLVLTKGPHLVDSVYEFGGNPVARVMAGGAWIE